MAAAPAVATALSESMASVWVGRAGKRSGGEELWTKRARAADTGVYLLVAELCALQRLGRTRRSRVEVVDGLSLEYSVTVKQESCRLCDLPEAYYQSLASNAGRFSSLLVECARALSSIHNAGVIHGNVRPDTIMVNLKDGQGEKEGQCPWPWPWPNPSFVDFEYSHWISRSGSACVIPRANVRSIHPFFVDPSRMIQTKEADAYSLGKTFLWLLVRMAFGRRVAEKMLVDSGSGTAEALSAPIPAAAAAAPTFHTGSSSIGNKAPGLFILEQCLSELRTRWSVQYSFAVGQTMSNLLVPEMTRRVPLAIVPRLIRHCAQVCVQTRDISMSRTMLDDELTMHTTVEVSMPLIGNLVNESRLLGRWGAGGRGAGAEDEAEEAEEEDEEVPRTISPRSPSELLMSMHKAGCDAKTSFLKASHILSRICPGQEGDASRFERLFSTFVLCMIVLDRWKWEVRRQHGDGATCTTGEDKLRVLHVAETVVLCCLVDRLSFTDSPGLRAVMLLCHIMNDLLTTRSDNFLHACIMEREALVAHLREKDAAMARIHGVPYMATTKFMCVCVTASEEVGIRRRD